jgi:hypothetical protein
MTPTCTTQHTSTRRKRSRSEASLWLIVGIAVGVATLGCFIARPHPFLACLAVSASLITLAVCATVARTVKATRQRPGLVPTTPCPAPQESDPSRP